MPNGPSRSLLVERMDVRGANVLVNDTGDKSPSDDTRKNCYPEGKRGTRPGERSVIVWADGLRDAKNEGPDGVGLFQWL